MPFAERVGVEVEGGTLTVGLAGSASGPVVLCLHGISSSHLSWIRVARELLEARPDLRIVAPDARGRGHSDELAGPYGIRANAADAVAVLDALGVRSAVLAGHSMGGWVAARIAAEHPERVAGVVLVDGGVGGRSDPRLTLESVLGPAVTRLRRTFASRKEYLDFWRAHPAYADGRFNADVEAGALYDLRGEPPELRARAREAAVRADFSDIFEDQAIRNADERMDAPVWLVRAGRGMLDGPDPFIPGDAMEAFASRHPDARIHDLPAENHYTVTLGGGAAVTAGAIAEALG